MKQHHKTTATSKYAILTTLARQGIRPSPGGRKLIIDHLDAVAAAGHDPRFWLYCACRASSGLRDKAAGLVSKAKAGVLDPLQLMPGREEQMLIERDLYMDQQYRPE